VARLGAFVAAPSDAVLCGLYEGQRVEEPTFAALGAARRHDAIAGFHTDHHSTPVADWNRAVEGLRHWRPQRGSGLDVYPRDAVVATGTTVLVVMRVAMVAVVASCRVVDVVDEPDCFGFCYATLPLHPECGGAASSDAPIPGSDGIVTHAGLPHPWPGVGWG
jgi:hypothetical protein